ncbi:polysaccharide deacetylase family protein [Thermodesulfobacteriota bacterium]
MCYHRLNHSLDQPYSVLPEVFEWQVDYIKKRGVEIVSLSDLVHRHTKKKSGKTRTVLLTADDGWKDFMNVLPVIKKKRLPFTLFLYPDAISYKDYLSLEDLRALKKTPLITLGCHSYTHQHLPGLGAEALLREVAESKKVLKKMSRQKISAFAYPYGIYDERVRNIVSKHYRSAFRINPELNTENTDLFALNRFTVYKTTTFGEFSHMVARLTGNSPQTFSINPLGYETDPVYHLNYLKIKLYTFSAHDSQNTVIVLPGSLLGAGWAYRTIRALSESGTECRALAYRNSSVSHLSGKKKEALGSWGLDAYLEDIEIAFRHILKNGGKAVILTWGDGFDLTMAFLSKYGEFRKSIRGVVAINPSVLKEIVGQDSFSENMRIFEDMLARREYTTGRAEAFLKIKTLCDLAVLKPKSPSPLAALFGYKAVSNEDLLKTESLIAEDPAFSIDCLGREYSEEDFRNAFMQPLPLFNMAVPTALQRDLHALWAEGFRLETCGVRDAEGLEVPFVFLFSVLHKDNIKRIQTVFPKSKIIGNYYLSDLSTVEIMLSKKTPGILRGEVEKLFGLSADR